ncbi:hypothetical protein HNR25_004133 [Streptomonospora salina]|uniref:Uncharacterized protein n=1 Tax=Streptomonospora salina TaxID=104205 RepID=A0A841EBG8_9ACTN|nr:hypothetical protein [Streptomonospora salina]
MDAREPAVAEVREELDSTLPTDQPNMEEAA